MTQHLDLLRHNGLLSSISAADLTLLQPGLQPVEIKLHDIVERSDKPIPFVYFPESGVLSIIASLGGGRDIEVGLAGYEGMSGTALTQLDSQSPYTTVVQMPGRALRISSEDFLAALDASASFKSLMIRYTRAFHIQVGFTALSNVRSKLAERLARWLLMIHDRSEGDRMDLTHEYMSVMLGVRRPGVTVALHILEGKGLIRSTRGMVTMVDREGMVREAIDAYGRPEAEYSRLTGIPIRKRCARDGRTAMV